MGVTIGYGTLQKLQKLFSPKNVHFRSLIKALSKGCDSLTCNDHASQIELGCLVFMVKKLRKLCRHLQHQKDLLDSNGRATLKLARDLSSVT